MTDDDQDLRAVLETLDPDARSTLRRVLIHAQADRDAIASDLLRYRDGRGDDWADIIDMLTLRSEERVGEGAGVPVHLAGTQALGRTSGSSSSATEFMQ